MTNTNINDHQKIRSTHRRKKLLIALDLIMLLAAIILMLSVYPSSFDTPSAKSILFQSVLGIACIIPIRMAGRVYSQVWRFVNTGAYLRIILFDLLGGCLWVLISRVVPFDFQITFMHIFAIVVMNLLCSLAYRFVYQWLYEKSVETGEHSRFTAILHTAFGYHGKNIGSPKQKIRIAIVGAGRVGAALAEELRNNSASAYRPVCFIDVDSEKIGRSIHGIPVLHESEATASKFAELMVQEAVLALPEISTERKNKLYSYYSNTGCKVKVYDYPIAQSVEKGKRKLREFDIEDLLFRKTVELMDERTKAFYRGKTILISGGGGSIGSELCRQLAQMNPKKLILLDVYENAAYDIQQELRMAYGDQLDLAVEIITICDRAQLEKVFEYHRPQIVLHAAAHKHVPLMEHNCVEAVRNNVFGTLNIVEVSEAYGVEKFIMVSTDKAVNPTNVMGATKRMCEMLVQSKVGSKTSFSATRFGNVLGSNGSVIPLFKRQIANGGPVTLTDKRIIRYFMTIPEASQLVLTSGAMAQNGELYVLDMGKPIKILELAENMIRLSGYEPYKDIAITETGLRPGEKLYEELLIKTEDLTKTDNDLIFVETDKPKDSDLIQYKLKVLSDALETGENELVKEALKAAVPTFHNPEMVNEKAAGSAEMKQAFSQVG